MELYQIRQFLRNQRIHFPKFVIVGIISTIFNYGLFYILLTYSGVNYIVSSGLGYVLGVFVGFYLNKFFTFESKSRKYTLEVTKYFGIYTVSLVLGLLFLKGLVFVGVGVLIANVLNIGLTTFTNYLGSKYLVFSKSKIFTKKLDYVVYKYRYFLRYVIIGLSSILIEVFLLIIFGGYFNKYLVTIVGFFLGMTFSFILNLKLNFDIPRNLFVRAYGYFVLISVIMYLLNIGAIAFFSEIGIKNYSYSRLISAGILFSIGYLLHRKITFKDTKKVGVAIYLSEDENVPRVEGKVGQLIDWIHIDLVDKTMKKDASEVDLSKGEEIRKYWPGLMKMTHIMSEYPSRWIERVSHFSDVIVVHAKTKENLEENIRMIKSLGKGVGVCIFAGRNERISVEILKSVNIVQILGIDKPGSSGQSMNEVTVAKLKRWIDYSKKFDFEISIDGTD